MHNIRWDIKASQNFVQYCGEKQVFHYNGDLTTGDGVVNNNDESITNAINDLVWKSNITYFVSIHFSQNIIFHRSNQGNGQSVLIDF